MQADERGLVDRQDLPRKTFVLHGAERDRTADLLNAIQALSQLSYSPHAITRSQKPELSKTVYR